MARRQRRYAPTARRKLIWARGTTDLAPAATGTAIDLLAQFRADGGTTLGATITRVHIGLSLGWTAWVPNSADRLYNGVLVDQLDQPEAQVPRPAVEPHADWMWWSAAPVVPTQSALTAASPVPATAVSVFAYDVLDVKSQRKCEELGQTVWYVADPTFNGGTVLDMTITYSVLLRLP